MSLAPIVHELRLACPVQVAFDTYVDRIGEWWPRSLSADPETFAGVSIERAVGGRVVGRDAAGDHEWGRVTVWEPTARIAYTSTLAQAPSRPTLVRVDIGRRGHATAVRLEHGGWAPGTERIRSRFTDWPRILSRFALLAEHPEPEK